MLHRLYHNRQIARALERWAGRYDRPLPPASAREQELIHELRERIAAWTPPAPERPAPSERIWLSFMDQFRNAVLEEDPREFLRWPMIRKAMCVTHQPFLAAEYLWLRTRRDWIRRWKPALRESGAGHPAPFALHPRSSGNLVHHAYHLSRFEACVGREVLTFPSVLEFGGGYGSMCRLFHQLGFQGRYVIFDLPPFRALQEFYLKLLELPVRRAGSSDTSAGAIVCSSEEREVDSLVGQEWGRTLFLATWSISETPRDVRERYMPLAAQCDAVLIAYWRQFEEMDNRAYFTDWADRHPEFRWVHTGVPTLPDHFYLFGVRRGQLDG